MGFADGSIKYLVSKPSMCGFGMNWQNCNNMILCGLSDSFEQSYQAIRRSYTFGQTKEVNVYVITSEAESNVLNNVKQKQANHELMSREMMKVTTEISKEKLYQIKAFKSHYAPKVDMDVPAWL